MEKIIRLGQAVLDKKRCMWTRKLVDEQSVGSQMLRMCRL